MWSQCIEPHWWRAGRHVRAFLSLDVAELEPRASALVVLLPLHSGERDAHVRWRCPVWRGCAPLTRFPTWWPCFRRIETCSWSRQTRSTLLWICCVHWIHGADQVRRIYILALQCTVAERHSFLPICVRVYAFLNTFLRCNEKLNVHYCVVCPTPMVQRFAFRAPTINIPVNHHQEVTKVGFRAHVADLLFEP